MSPYLTTPPRFLEQACADLGIDPVDYAPDDRWVDIIVARLIRAGVPDDGIMHELEIRE